MCIGYFCMEKNGEEHSHRVKHAVQNTQQPMPKKEWQWNGESAILAFRSGEHKGNGVEIQGAEMVSYSSYLLCPVLQCTGKHLQGTAEV